MLVEEYGTDQIKWKHTFISHRLSRLRAPQVVNIAVQLMFYGLLVLRDIATRTVITDQTLQKIHQVQRGEKTASIHSDSSDEKV